MTLPMPPDDFMPTPAEIERLGLLLDQVEQTGSHMLANFPHMLDDEQKATIREELAQVEQQRAWLRSKLQ